HCPIGRRGPFHGAKRKVRIAEPLENLHVELRSLLSVDSGQQFERVFERPARFMVGISARRVFSREDQVLNRSFVLASFFKVQSDLCGGPRSVFEAKGFETVSQALMEFHPLRWIQAPVKNLAI